MRKFAQVCAGATLIVCLGAPASADPVRIISGSLGVDMFDPQGPNNSGITLVGERGFSFSAEWFSITPAAAACSLACETGDIISPDWELTVTGNRSPLATLDGTTYPLGSTQVAFHFDGPEFTLVLPPTGGLVYTVPFTFAGTFLFPGGSELLTGGGTVRLTFARNGDQAGIIGTHYTFADATSPVPEPASALLLASGLALTARRIARRKAAKKDLLEERA